MIHCGITVVPLDVLAAHGQQQAEVFSNFRQSLSEQNSYLATTGYTFWTSIPCHKTYTLHPWQFQPISAYRFPFIAFHHGDNDSTSA